MKPLLGFSAAITRARTHSVNPHRMSRLVPGERISRIPKKIPARPHIHARANDHAIKHPAIPNQSDSEIFSRAVTDVG
jgi:hypothetical protein